MQPAFSTPFPEPLPAAMPQLSEKPRHGVRSWNPAPHPGFNVCNSTAVLGLQFNSSGIVSGPVVAPNNNQQPQQKKPCSTTTRIAGTIKALQAAGDAGGSFTLAGIHFGAAGLLVGAGCLDPTPFEPATCIAAGFGGASLTAGGGVLTGLGVYQVKESISGIKQAITCEE
jgi:hypothetical protein